MNSIWTETINMEERPALQGDVTTDTVVIGSGLAGVLIAYFLQQKGIHTVVLEADRIGSGQTKNTTAKITIQHNLIYDKLINNFGIEKASQYAQINQQAIKEYKTIINQKKIDCSFMDMPAYLYSREEEGMKKLQQEEIAAKKLGIQAEFTTSTTLPFPVTGALKFSDQGQFNPLAFLQAISKELTIFEQTKVIGVEDNRVITNRGIVTAKHIVFATHFPFINAPGFYFARMHQERSYVLALEHAAKLDGMYLGIDKESLSFRNYNDLLLLGGGGYRTGENSKGGKYTLLREQANIFYPQSKETLHWSAQDCMTLDSVPYIGQFSASTPNWYVATGFGKWGMTSSMVSAILISDYITGAEHPCSSVFSPLRFTPTASMSAFVTNMGQAVKGISKRAFSYNQIDAKDLPAGHGGVVEYKDEKVGVYKDEQNRIFVVSVRCPHLGCQLEWNPDEKSWDCPCHGSRFDYKGKLLNNPALTNLEDIYNEENHKE